MKPFYRDLKRLPNLINGFLVRKIIQGIFAKTEKYFERSNVSMRKNTPSKTIEPALENNPFNL